MRLPALALAFTVAACTHSGRTVVRPSPVPTPAPTGIYVTTREYGSDFFGEGPPFIHTKVPALHGLPAAVAAPANQALGGAVDDETSRPDPEQAVPKTVFVEGELGVVTDRYVTVDLVVTRVHEAASYYDLRPVVIDRRTGRRMLFGDLLAPGALRAIASYANARLPVVLGRHVPALPATREVLDRVTPLPEGLEVALPGWYVGAPHIDPVYVVVPWARLAAHLRSQPPSGPREPGYRDGRRPRDYERAILVHSYPYPATRWQISQRDDSWALAEVARGRIALHAGDGGWRVYEEGKSAGCATMPAAVRASFGLGC